MYAYAQLGNGNSAFINLNEQKPFVAAVRITFCRLMNARRHMKISIRIFARGERISVAPFWLKCTGEEVLMVMHPSKPVHLWYFIIFQMHESACKMHAKHILGTRHC